MNIFEEDFNKIVILLNNFLPISGVIHVGMGTGRMLKIYHEMSVKFGLFIDADFQLCSDFKETLDNERKNWEVINSVIHDKNLIMPFYSYSNISENGLLGLDCLRYIWKNLKNIEVQNLQTTSLANILFEKNILLNECPYNWIVVECFLGENIVSSLEGYIDSVEVIIIRAITADLPCASALEKNINDFLSEKKFNKIYSLEENNPSVAYIFYTRNHKEGEDYRNSLISTEKNDKFSHSFVKYKAKSFDYNRYIKYESYAHQSINSYFFPNSKIIYDPVQKCGNSSIFLSLLVSEGVLNHEKALQLCSTSNPIILGYIQDLASRFKIRSSSRFNELITKYDRVCFIRDPLDRLVSAINDKLVANNKLYANTNKMDYVYWVLSSHIMNAKYWRGGVMDPPRIENLMEGFTINDFFERYLLDVDPVNLDWHFIPFSVLVKNKNYCTFMPISSIKSFLKEDLGIESYEIHRAKEKYSTLPSSLDTNLNQYNNYYMKDLKKIISESKYYLEILDLYKDDYLIFNFITNEDY